MEDFLLLVGLLLLIALGEVVVGSYRLCTRKPGITGIVSPRLRVIAWLLCGTDIRRNGTEGRLSLGNCLGGTLQVVLGLVAGVLLTGTLFG